MVYNRSVQRNNSGYEQASSWKRASLAALAGLAIGGAAGESANVLMRNDNALRTILDAAGAVVGAAIGEQVIKRNGEAVHEPYPEAAQASENQQSDV